MRNTIRTWLYSSVGLGALALTITTSPMVALADDPQNLGKMVISANRTETPVDQVGSSVSIITAEDIEKKQAITALDVIKDAPGLNVYSNGGYGKSTGLFMRGMGYKNILVLIDGVEVADPSGSQTTYDLTHLQANNIERIEILRGNQSTLYGSDAMGGVISITTKSGKGSGKLYSGTAGMEYGTYNTRKGYVNAQGEFNDIYYGASVSALNTDGFDISNTTPGKENDGYKNQSMDLKVGSDVIKDVGVLDRLNIEGLVRYMRGDTDYDGSGTQDGLKEIRNTQKSGKFSVRADMFQGLLSNTLSASQAISRRDYYEDHVRSSTGFYDGEKTKYEYLGTLKPIEDHTIVFGADHEREHMKTASISPQEVTNDGIFGNYQITLLEKALTMTVGARQDNHETFGEKTTYRTTIGYNIQSTGTHFHTSYGTGFRAPSLFELYSPIYGVKTLKPEESRGYDFGIEQSLFDGRLTLDTTFFNSRLSDEIAYDSTRKKYYNIASSRTFGLENTATAQISDEWEVSGGYTYQQARDNTTGKVLATRPHHTGSLRVSYSPDDVSGLNLWTKARFATWSYDSYANKTFTGGYTVWDFGASYPITEWAKVYGRVENLTDKLFHTKGEYAETGRAGYVGMTLNF
ncbi:MAG: TonB-dependent receptor [Rhodospirillaceae bacterium]|nr:TonB-dependent receptor [Rhodospirillaceae bacterium]